MKQRPFRARWLALAVLCAFAMPGAVAVSSGTALAATSPDTTAPSKPATPTIRPTGSIDNDGNRSPRSDPLTFTTPSKPAPTCRVQRSVFGTNFMVQVFVENLTTVTIISRSGDQATFTAGASGITSIVPGLTLNVGAVASNPANAPLPGNFAFNSPAFGTISCAVS
jgi:hypothetical protein